VLVLGASVVLAPSIGQTPSPSSAASASPIRTGGGLGWPFPDQVRTSQGIFPVLSVGDAVRVRDDHAGPVEIAVGGWSSEPAGKRFCTMVLRDRASELQNLCVFDRWLAPQPLPNTDWYPTPPGLAIRIFTDWVPKDSTDIHLRDLAVGAVVLGHFHDAVAAQCRPENADLCTGTFIVDEVPWTFSTTGYSAAPSNPDLSPLTVSEAIAIRDSGASTELAVAGWYVSNPIPCPHPPDQYWPLEDCLFNYTWLMAGDEELQVLNADGSGYVHPPVGPAISVAAFNNPGGDHLPKYTILIGHFNDSRASDCPAGARRTACAQRFVLDDVLEMDGAPSASP
jgi:hypothetical protein